MMLAENKKRINISKSKGPDGIHPKLLKELEHNSSFVSAVTKLFQTCVSSGKIPEQWKTANVTSLYKKGSRKDALNYRPVSLTCILCNSQCNKGQTRAQNFFSPISINLVPKVASNCE